MMGFGAQVLASSSRGCTPPPPPRLPLEPASPELLSQRGTKQQTPLPLVCGDNGGDE